MGPRLKATLGVLFALIVGSATLTGATSAATAASEPQTAMSATTSASTPTAAELANFREDLSRALQQLGEQAAAIRETGVLAPSMQKSTGDPRSIADRAQEDLRTMSAEQLAQVYVAFESAFPSWRQAAGALERVAGQARTMSSDGTVRPSAITPDNCQDAFNAEPSWTDWGVTVAFAIAAEGAFNIIPPPVNATAMAFWIPLAEGANAAELLNLMFERCSGDKSERELKSSITSAVTTIVSRVGESTTEIINNGDSNTATVISVLNDARTTIIDTVNKNSGDIINNDNSNTVKITNTVNEARDVIVANDDENARNLSALLLRTQIEADLAEADNATPVAWYQTPADRGGHLDTVQAIVAETVANVGAAGGDTRTAQRFLDRADAAKATGDFKAAYFGYKKAYQAAAN